MSAFQRRFLYFPDKQIGLPEQYGLQNFTELTLKSDDDIALQAWYKEAMPGMPTILYFHGNASHIGNRAGIYSALAGQGFGVLSLSYRGYGKSQGAPSEQGLYNDARAAVKFLTQEKGISLDGIILYGESLGTGVAVQIATEYKVGGLILQAPYTSVVGRASEIYFFIPVRRVLREHFNSLDKISRVKSPLLILHGALDATIPIRHGKLLLESANHPKDSVFFDDVGHNNFDSAVIAQKVRDFATTHSLMDK
jgi:fermentation-respiration switch protein FrsA (DUF1100 family)